MYWVQWSPPRSLCKSMFSFMIRLYFRHTSVESNEVLLEVCSSRCLVLSDYISDTHVLSPMKSSLKSVEVDVWFYDQIIFQTHKCWIQLSVKSIEVFLKVGASHFSALQRFLLINFLRQKSYPPPPPPRALIVLNEKNLMLWQKKRKLN